jgi:virulence protein VirJ
VRRRAGAASCVALASILCGACAARAARPATAPRVDDRFIVLNDHSLQLHFANPSAGTARPLLVYATGDGGWHRKDLASFHHLVALGNPIVGFDARDYVTHLGGSPDATTTPARLAQDYERIIAAGKNALHLPATGPVILVGISRGAGLSVAAAGAASLRPSVSGVLAVALTREEEYVQGDGETRLDSVAAQGLGMVDLYGYLPLLAQMPVAVVQSTRDGYLPADAARALLGPDTPYRWLQAVDARNHSFGGGRTQMYEAMQRALQWIDSVISRRQV